MTKDELTEMIATLLPDNTTGQISAADLRAVLTAMVNALALQT